MDSAQEPFRVKGKTLGSCNSDVLLLGWKNTPKAAWPHDPHGSGGAAAPNEKTPRAVLWPCHNEPDRL